VLVPVTGGARKKAPACAIVNPASNTEITQGQALAVAASIKVNKNVALD
jgi:hypothetical protein